MLQLFNTLSRQKETFKPLSQEKVKIYYCGPTVYNFAHIGNLRTYLFEDFIVKTLRYLGYKVETTMNITDIDDKTIRDSMSNNIKLLELTRKYTDFFLEDLKKLNIQHADNIQPISDIVPEMIDMINGLFAKWYAYLGDGGSVYYSIAKFKHYGELAHLDMKGMRSSVRINNDEYEKDQAADFALWKGYDAEKDGENFWDAKFMINGEEKIIRGRPGWHIECSACNMRHFGAQVDIHMGGIDNLFPHHQNEVAQSEAFSGKQFVKYWVHGAHLLVDGKKMSKSADNFYRLVDIVVKMPHEKERHVLLGFRLMAFQNRYREELNFTFDRLQAAINTLKSLDEFLKRIKRYVPKDRMEGLSDGKIDALKAQWQGVIRREFRENLQALMQNYIEHLEDDFSTPEALADIFELITWINKEIDSETLSAEELTGVIDFVRSIDEVIWVFDFSLLEAEESASEEVLVLLEARNMAKAEKNWSLADEIRAKITELWYKVVDDKAGARVERL